VKGSISITLRAALSSVSSLTSMIVNTDTTMMMMRLRGIKSSMTYLFLVVYLYCLMMGVGRQAYIGSIWPHIHKMTPISSNIDLRGHFMTYRIRDYLILPYATI